MTSARRRRAGGELWTAVDRRVVAYVRLDGAGSPDLPRHLVAIERLCDLWGLEPTDVMVDVEGGVEAATAPPGLAWALARLAAGRTRALAVARTDHVAGAFADAGQLIRCFRDRGVILVAADSAGDPGHETAEVGTREPRARTRRRGRRPPAVGPRSWARYVHARADDVNG